MDHGPHEESISRVTAQDHYAHWSYDNLIVSQPHIDFEGLWQVGRSYFVLCPGVENAKTTDGEDLRAWFEEKCRVVTADITIVESLPPGAKRVPERTLDEQIELSGAPRTLSELIYEFSMLVPADFPDFTFNDSGGIVRLVSSRPLREEERVAALNAFHRLLPGVELEFLVNPERSIPDALPLSPSPTGVVLTPARWLPKASGRALRDLVQEDDDFWIDARRHVLGEPLSNPVEILPPDWHSKKRLACLVDATTFPPHDLRTYLSLYETVMLAPPISDCFDENCRAMGATPDELVELIAMGRVRLLLPQPIDRYPIKWLSRIAEIAPHHCLLSRRLAAATIAEARRRIPFLFPALTAHERSILLRELARLPKLEPDLVRLMDAFVGGLVEMWSTLEWSVHTRGALGTAPLGVGALTSALYQAITGQDRTLELWSAALSVEWAAALGAHVFPYTDEGYRGDAACELVASVYSIGREFEWSHQTELQLRVVTKMLTLKGRIDLVSFARDFHPPELVRLRRLIIRMATEHVDPDELEEAVEQFSAVVRHLEREANPQRLLTIAAPAMGWLGSKLLSFWDRAPGWLPWASRALISGLTTILLKALRKRSETFGTLEDWLVSSMAGRPNADAMLVARLRHRVHLHRR